MSEKDPATELNRVEICAKCGHYSAGVMSYITAYCGELFKLHMIHGNGGVLELGPAEGVMTDLLYPDFSEDYTVVDGAEFFIDALKKRYPNIKCRHSLFEEFNPQRQYENIILGHVLEHVADPVAILKQCYN